MRTLDSHTVQGIRVESENLENGRGHLHGLDGAGNDAWGKSWIGDQQHDVDVVMGKAAVLHQLLMAASVTNTDVGGDYNVRRPRIIWWQPGGCS